VTIYLSIPSRGHQNPESSPFGMCPSCIVNKVFFCNFNRRLGTRCQYLFEIYTPTSVIGSVQKVTVYGYNVGR
jgi:hypothetical protein